MNRAVWLVQARGTARAVYMDIVGDSRAQGKQCAQETARAQKGTGMGDR